jgi:hypothetical protein
LEVGLRNHIDVVLLGLKETFVDVGRIGVGCSWALSDIKRLQLQRLITKAIFLKTWRRGHSSFTLILAETSQDIIPINGYILLRLWTHTKNRPLDAEFSPTLIFKVSSIIVSAGFLPHCRFHIGHPTSFYLLRELGTHHFILICLHPRIVTIFQTGYLWALGHSPYNFIELLRHCEIWYRPPKHFLLCQLHSGAWASLLRTLHELTECRLLIRELILVSLPISGLFSDRFGGQLQSYGQLRRGIERNQVSITEAKPWRIIPPDCLRSFRCLMRTIRTAVLVHSVEVSIRNLLLLRHWHVFLSLRRLILYIQGEPLLSFQVTLVAVLRVTRVRQAILPSLIPQHLLTLPHLSSLGPPLQYLRRPLRILSQEPRTENLPQFLAPLHSNCHSRHLKVLLVDAWGIQLAKAVRHVCYLEWVGKIHSDNDSFANTLVVFQVFSYFTPLDE